VQLDIKVIAVVVGMTTLPTTSLASAGCEGARDAPPASVAVDHPSCAVHAQPANGQLRIGTHTSSTARACRPYDLRYLRDTPRTAEASDLWWSLGKRDNVLDVVLDRPFVARRLDFDLYGWFRGDATLCRGSIEVAINGRPAGRISAESGCTGRAEQNFSRTVTLDLDQPTVVVSLRLTDRLGASGPRAGFITLAGVALSTVPVVEPVVASVVDVWAEVHEPPPGIPGPGLWVVRPGQPPRVLGGPLPSDGGNEVGVWETATDDQPRLIHHFERDILNAWYDECVAALVVELVDHSTALAFVDGRVRPPSCE